MTWLAIGLGGALGAMGRYGVGLLLAGWLGRGFPWGTLTVNLVGSTLIGLLFVLLARQPDSAGVELLRGGLLVGLLGGFTTFSSFSLEAMGLFEAGRSGAALAYIGASLALCLLGVWLGSRVGQLL